MNFTVSDERKKELDYHLKHWMPKGRTVSECGYRCAELVSRLVGGLHHVDHKSAARADWSDTCFVRLAMPFESFSSFDFCTLTRLVFLSHELCIRTTLVQSGPRSLALMMHPRHTRTGDGSVRHPDIWEAVGRWAGCDHEKLSEFANQLISEKAE